MWNKFMETPIGLGTLVVEEVGLVFMVQFCSLDTDTWLT